MNKKNLGVSQMRPDGHEPQLQAAAAKNAPKPAPLPGAMHKMSGMEKGKAATDPKAKKPGARAGKVGSPKAKTKAAVAVGPAMGDGPLVSKVKSALAKLKK